MLKNRRAESQARALLSRAEHLMARASAQLLGGEALAAMRLLRAADQLISSTAACAPSAPLKSGSAPLPKMQR